jgi:3-hydroxyisobutyrate dehydrogenase-like beta-hydroxyacid dehydrogenase
VLGDVDADTDLEGHTLANMTAGNSAEAAAMEPRAHALGLSYLEGHIGVTPDLIGADTTSLMFCGPSDLWEQHRERLMLLGPESVYLGDDIQMNGRLAAGISVFFNTALVGFLEGLADARAIGIPLDTFLTTADNRLITLQGFMSHSVAQAQTRDYAADLANIDAHFDGIKAHFPEVAGRGHSHRMADAVVAYLQQAVDEGHAGDSIAVLLDLMERGE